MRGDGLGLHLLPGQLRSSLSAPHSVLSREAYQRALRLVLAGYYDIPGNYLARDKTLSVGIGLLRRVPIWGSPASEVSEAVAAMSGLRTDTLVRLAFIAYISDSQDKSRETVRLKKEFFRLKLEGYSSRFIFIDRLLFAHPASAPPETEMMLIPSPEFDSSYSLDYPLQFGSDGKISSIAEPPARGYDYNCLAEICEFARTFRRKQWKISGVSTVETFSFGERRRGRSSVTTYAYSGDNFEEDRTRRWRVARML